MCCCCCRRCCHPAFLRGKLRVSANKHDKHWEKINMKNRKKVQLQKKNKKKIKYQKIMHMKKENKAEKKTNNWAHLYTECVQWVVRCGVAWLRVQIHIQYWSSNINVVHTNLRTYEQYKYKWTQNTHTHQHTTAKQATNNQPSIHHTTIAQHTAETPTDANSSRTNDHATTWHTNKQPECISSSRLRYYKYSC